MKRFLTQWTFAIALLSVVSSIPIILVNGSGPDSQYKESKHEETKEPNDWFLRQRAYPAGRINYQAYNDAMRQAGQMRAFSKPALNGGEWMFAGPTNIGGRVTTLAVVRQNINTIYAGTAAGGVFKTEDGGQSWRALFDKQPSLAIGDLTIDPNDTNVIYAGTGEPNASLVCYGGAGMFKSTDGGESWKSLGLENTRNIGRVVVDPHDSRRIYVAAMGEVYEPSASRGLYRSTDRGESWENIFHVDDTTGCVDIVVHPTNPNILYTAAWERIATPSTFKYGGDSSGIYRSTDAGAHWSRLKGGLPLQPMGRIGLAVAPSDPSRLYAVYADDAGLFAGIFRSDDGGGLWSPIHDENLGFEFCYNFGWWFGNVRVNPVNADEVYALGLDLWRSTAGGGDWNKVDGRVHPDQHALYIHPDMPSFMVAGNDGGIYISTDAGNNWRHSKNFPATQFYTCEIDNLHPERLYGGTQDNYTVRTMTGRPDDWADILGGDGFVVRVDPTTSDYIYAEYQGGGFNRSTDGGQTMLVAKDGIAPEDRFNWNAPFVIDPGDHNVLYFASQRLYRSTNRAGIWRAISPDLTNGRIGFSYGTITTIDVAVSDPRVIYIGCDDGNVWTTSDRGGDWRKINAGLPKRWVTRVAVDPIDPAIAYVTLSGYRYVDYQPHVLRTTNSGQTWADISTDLPEAPVNDIIIDPANRNTLIVATDVGVFYTSAPGASWVALGTDLPVVPVLDLTLHHPTRKLVAATFGRSMYSLDVSFLSGVESPGNAGTGAHAMAIGPNPFTSSTTIRFPLANAEEGELDIHDLSGRRVRRLAQGRLEPGQRSYAWDGRGDDGAPAPAGEYIVRLWTRDTRLTGRVVLVR